jgi:hypothetical protein
MLKAGNKDQMAELIRELEQDDASDHSFSGEDPKHRLVINVGQTEYDVIKKVARKICNWRLKYF